MANALVERGRLEANVLVWLTAQVEAHLPQAKQVRVADQHGAGQYGEPAKSEKADEYPLTSGILDAPHGFRHGPPLPIKQVEAETGEQDVGAAFNGKRNKLRPASLEPRTRHHAMLNGEEAQ